MNENLFRKKSVDRVNSPEQLNDYLRVANPGVWIVLVAILVFLAGVCVWGFAGKLDTVLKTAAISDGKVITVYVKENKIASIDEDTRVTINGKKYKISDISSEPVAIDDTFSEYALYVGSFKKGEWVYRIVLKGNLSEGTYSADIVTESVSPISFVIN